MSSAYKESKHCEPKDLVFSLFTEEEIRKISVAKIYKPFSLDKLYHPIKGGLYDPTLGPLNDDSDPCGTCGLGPIKCAGHFGHIELPLTVVNPLFHKTLATILKLTCTQCSTIQIPNHIKLILSAKLKLLKAGFYSEILELEQQINFLLPKQQKFGEEIIAHIQEIIDSFMENLYNRNKCSSQSVKNFGNSNTSNVNMEFQVHIEEILKNCKSGKVCIKCQAPIPKITTSGFKILRQTIRQNVTDPSVIRKQVLVPILPDTLRKIMRNLWKKEEESLKVIVPLLANIKYESEKKRTIELSAMDTLNSEDEAIENTNSRYKCSFTHQKEDQSFPTDIFFFNIIPVIPPNVRPVNYLNGQLMQHPRTETYEHIIKYTLILKRLLQEIKKENGDVVPEEEDEGLEENTKKRKKERDKEKDKQVIQQLLKQIQGSTLLEKLYTTWDDLQIAVNHLMDRDMNKNSESASCLGIKQLIEKKEGIIRMHMMGKRVNFSARSVITPDPNLDVDEIGIPEAFALKLTYPIPVNPWNVTELRRLVLNGPDVHPGAALIEYEDGTMKRISGESLSQRESIAKTLMKNNEKSNQMRIGTKIVHRHLRNGDMLLANRQPTLHKPSIMAHRARILKSEKTIRLHYANCKAYNADFDGDEINLHFPQTEVARSEAKFIASVSNQYLVPKDGTPLSGLIQDHIISGVRLTMRGRFFDRGDYQNLVFSALWSFKSSFSLLPPTILKPKKLWSGKQVLSTVVINLIPKERNKINLVGSSKLGAKEWISMKPRIPNCGTPFAPDIKTMSEAEVIFRNGELLSGVLDKAHYGATAFGLIHCVHELYGGDCCMKMLSAFSKLFQNFQMNLGFSLGVEDILVTKKADKKRRKLIDECRKIGDSIQKSVLQLPEDTERNQVVKLLQREHLTNPKFIALLDRKYKVALDNYTNQINKACLPAGLLKKFPDNNLQMMVQSGAKGSTVNTMQISCLLGQIELEGKRPPLMISGRSLPCFPPYDPSPRAGGFIVERFMTGLGPPEFFFHCMAGREGLIDTAVKTSRSGYLQRCLVKHLEGVSVEYDSTVRDSDGSVIQFVYGEDGLDICNSQFLKSNQLDFLVENKNAIIIEQQLLNELKENSNITRKTCKKLKKWKNKHGPVIQKRRDSPFTAFSRDKLKLSSSKRNLINKNSGRTKATLHLIRDWYRTSEEDRKPYRDISERCPDPITSKYRQDLEFGALTEQMEEVIDNYLDESRGKISKSELKDLISIKIMKSLCPPGESVGLLAAQSIGEPSTQMTLNTFHFAGRGEMNVTLGIPRLREILMMASKNIKTPSMEIPFKKNIPRFNKRVKEIRLKLTKCLLSDVLENINVHQKMIYSPQHQWIISLRINILPKKYYKHNFNTNPSMILKQIENKFFKEFFKELKKTSKTWSLLVIEENKKLIKEEEARLDEDEDEVDPSKTVRGNTGELHESSDEEGFNEETDASTARSLSRHQDNSGYDDPEEEEEIEDVEEVDGEEIMDDLKTNSSLINDDNKEEDVDFVPGENETRKGSVLTGYPNVLEYDYDEERKEWCCLKFWLPVKMKSVDFKSILKSVANKVVLWETPSIKRAFTFQNQEGETILKTEGINVVEMFKYNEILQLDRLYSNDIYGISQTYGIEAANRVIVKEVKDVFKMYGITVNSRHLSLIADYMTYDGTFKPMSRKGMEHSASPLQQITFESSLQFLKSATLRGKTDQLRSPSSRIMLGLPCRSGTGSMGVFSSLTKMIESQKTSAHW